MLPRCNWIAQRDNCRWALQQLGKEKLAKRTKPKNLFLLECLNQPRALGAVHGGHRASSLSTFLRGAGRRSNICSLVLNKGGRRASKAEPYKFPSRHHAQDGELLAWSLTAKRSGFSSKFTRCSHSGNNYLPSPPAVPRSLSDFLKEPPVAVFKQHEIRHRKGSCSPSLLGQDQKGRKEDRTWYFVLTFNLYSSC